MQNILPFGCPEIPTSTVLMVDEEVDGDREIDDTADTFHKSITTGLD